MTRHLVAAIAASSLLASAAFAKEAAKSMEPVSMAVSDLKFTPMMPGNADGPEIAVVHGDLKKGPVSFFLRTKKGGKSAAHIHTADYQAIVIEGAPSHIGSNETVAKPMTKGTWFMQPGKGVHTDECTGDTDCVLFVTTAGTFDYKPAGDMKKAGDAKPMGDAKGKATGEAKPADKK